MKKLIAPKRFISIRLSQAEFKEVQRHFLSSGCNSLTEYAISILTEKPVVVKNRNQSADDILECMINVKNKLILLQDQLLEKNVTQLEKELLDINDDLRTVRDSLMIILKSL